MISNKCTLCWFNDFILHKVCQLINWFSLRGWNLPLRKTICTYTYMYTWHVIHWPGVIQFESNRGSDGRITPFWRAFLTRSWASLADRNLLPRCWFILALGATPSTARKSTFWGLMIRKRDWKRRRKGNVKPAVECMAIEWWWNQMSVFRNLSYKFL